MRNTLQTSNLERLFQVTSGNRSNELYEKAFDDIAFEAGFVPVRSIIPGIENRGKNSDYYHPELKVIFELKAKRGFTNIDEKVKSDLNKYIKLNGGVRFESVLELNDTALIHAVYDSFRSAKTILQYADKQNRVTRNEFEKNGIEVVECGIIILNCDDFNLTPRVFARAFGDVIGKMQVDKWLKTSRIFTLASIDLNIIRDGKNHSHGFHVTQVFHERNEEARGKIVEITEIYNAYLHKAMCRCMHNSLKNAGHIGLVNPDGSDAPVEGFFDDLVFDGTKLHHKL